MNPGTIVLPVTSMTFAPLGIATLPFAPTAAIRLSVITISPCSMISSPFMATIFAPLKTTVPFGLERWASMEILTISGLSAGDILTVEF